MFLACLTKVQQRNETNNKQLPRSRTTSHNKANLPRSRTEIPKQRPQWPCPVLNMSHNTSPPTNKKIYICIIDFMGFCRNTEMVLCNTICIWFSSKQKGFSAKPFVERVLYKTIPEPLENHFVRVFYNTICKRFCEQPLEGSKNAAVGIPFPNPLPNPLCLLCRCGELV